MYWTQPITETDVNVPVATLALHNCILLGRDALVIPYVRQGRASLRLSRNTTTGARFICVGTEGSSAGSDAKLVVDASANVIDVGNAVVATPQASSLREWFVWKGQRNLLSRGRNLVEDASLPPGSLRKHVGRNLDDWNDYWKQTDSHSILGTVFFPCGTAQDLAGRWMHSDEELQRLAPRDMRFASLILNFGAPPSAEDRSRLGADVELVGPGKPYDTWRQTPEYEQWRRRVERDMNASN